MSSGEHNRVASCSSLNMTVRGNSRATSPCMTSLVFLSIRIRVTSFLNGYYLFKIPLDPPFSKGEFHYSLL